MENKKNSLIITTIAIMIMYIIVYLFNKTWQNIWSISSIIFYANIILGVLSIFLIRKNIDKYKNIIIVLNIIFVITGNIIGICNIVTIKKSKNKEVY